MKIIGKIMIVAILATFGNFQAFTMEKTSNHIGPKVEDVIPNKYVCVS